MTEAVLLLRLEHKNAADLLLLMEEQLDRDEPIDLDLMQSIVDYFTDYPEQCHHPVEDLVFRRLRARDETRAAAVGELLRDHKKISDLTMRLADAVTEAGDDELVRNTTLRELMRQFVDHYRRHMTAEETEFFPLTLDTLTADDWAAVEFDLFDRTDPLFDQDVEDKFHALRRRIEELARRSNRRSAFKRQVKRLRRLNGIQDFNESMEEAGLDYRLLVHPEGAFSVERRGEIVIDIPKCSPARAAWCANFFVEALTGQSMSD